MRTLITTALLSLLIAAPAVARQRAVRFVSPTVLFRSTVIDATTSKPVVNAQVAMGGVTTITDARGAFALTLPLNSPVTLVVSRSGYETAEFTVTATSTGTPLPFRLQSHTNVVVQTTDGQRLQFDAETVRFVSALPLQNAISITEGNFCRNGNEYDVDISDLSRINGPSVMSAGSSCCSHDVEWLDVTVKSGEQSHVSLRYSCFGYDVFLGGRDHDSFQQVYVKFSDIRQVDFP